jgi:hypothetical protein
MTFGSPNTSFSRLEADAVFGDVDLVLPLIPLKSYGHACIHLVAQFWGLQVESGLQTCGELSIHTRCHAPCEVNCWFGLQNGLVAGASAVAGTALVVLQNELIAGASAVAGTTLASLQYELNPGSLAVAGEA